MTTEESASTGCKEVVFFIQGHSSRVVNARPPRKRKEPDDQSWGLDRVQG